MGARARRDVRERERERVKEKRGGGKTDFSFFLSLSPSKQFGIENAHTFAMPPRDASEGLKMRIVIAPGARGTSEQRIDRFELRTRGREREGTAFFPLAANFSKYARQLPRPQPRPRLFLSCLSLSLPPTNNKTKNRPRRGGGLLPRLLLPDLLLCQRFLGPAPAHGQGHAIRASQEEERRRTGRKTEATAAATAPPLPPSSRCSRPPASPPRTAPGSTAKRKITAKPSAPTRACCS